MLFTKLFGKKNKRDEAQNEFKNLVKELNSQSQFTDIQICSQSYNRFFSDDSPEKLLTYPIKKDAILFLQYLIPAAILALEQNIESSELFTCLASISVFIQKDKDEVLNLYRLTILILTSTIKSALIKSESILQNFTNNLHFCEKIVNQNFFDIYQIGKPISEFNSNLSYFLLRKCIEKTKSIPTQKIVDEIKQHISESSAEHLCLIAVIYQYSKSQPDFDAFNQQIKIINNCSCYETLFLINNSLAKSKILELLQDPNEQLGASLLLLYLKTPLLFPDSSFFIKFLRFVDSNSQLQFFQNIKKQSPEKLSSIIEKVLPPWKSCIDGAVLYIILKNNFDSDHLVFILNQILTSPDKDGLSSAFSIVPNFKNLISSLFESIIEPDQFQIEFSHVIQLIIDGSTDLIQCLFTICQSNDPVNYIDAFKHFFPQLIEVPDFVAHLPELSDNELLQHYLITSEFISISVEKGLVDFIASLSKSGPHEIIDKIIVDKFDSSELKNLSQNDLIKLSKGLLQKESINLGSVKIPSLIPKISHFTFSSLSDRYVVGKYLFGKRIIDGESELVSTIGIQFLTPEIAYSIIDKPKILFELTNSTFPHNSVYQFEQNKPETFLVIIEQKVNFQFRVDQYDQEFILLELSSPVIKFKNNALLVGDMKFPCILKKWHSISINTNPTGSFHIVIDSSYKVTIDQTGQLIVGSRTNPPGSTFYIKAPMNYKSQFGKNVIYVDYKGFAYHSPRINAIPKIFSKLLETENKEEFCLYINSLLNIQCILSDSIDISTLLSLLRQIFKIKSDFVTEEVIQVILGLISTNGTIDWTLFKCFFVDYVLWSKLHNILLSPVCSIIQSILAVQSLDSNVVQSLSLYHFFLDLSLFMNISSEQLNKVIYLLSKYEEDKMSAFTIHLLKENIPQSLNFLMENENSIQDMIPIKFIQFTKPKLSLQILRMYSIKCLSSDSFIDFEELERLTPYFESLMKIKDFWITILTIACKCTFRDIQSFRAAELKVPKMIDIIFKLLCKFYQIDFNGKADDEILLESISDIVCSILFNTNNIDFYPYISSFKELAHFGLFYKNELLDPILFDSFEPCRLPIDSNNNNSNNSSIIEYSNTQTTSFYYKSDQFLKGNDLWFGLKSDNFSDICDEITKRKLLINISRSQAQMPENVQNQPNSMKIDKNIVFYENIIKIITNFLLQMNNEKLLTSLQDILLFNSNVNSQIAIKVHQSVIFSILRRSKPTTVILNFIKNMIIAGWWETQLDQLFSSICIVSLRVDENNSNTWNAIADVLKCILSLTSDYTKIQFKLYSNSVFHKSIICNISNLMFYFHILMSDSFLSSPRSYVQEIWYAFLFSIGSIDNHDGLLNIAFETESSGNNEIPIFQRINEVANSTSFFTEISPNDESFCSLLKNKAKDCYDEFINEQKVSMNDIYENIRSIRIKNKSASQNIQSSILYNPDLIEEVTNEIEKFAFMVRFNILSSRDEIDSFTLWSILPKLTLNKYQVGSSVHPISVPTLLIPFYTDVDLNDYKSYEELRMIKMKLNRDDQSSMELPRSEIPHCIDEFVSQPFFNISWKMNKQLFISSFSFYGKIINIDSILIISGLSEISSVLISCEKGFFIIVDSSINETEDDKHIFLHNHPKSLKVSTFIDNCASNYYGKTSLFNGHIVLQFQIKDILIAVPRCYLQDETACEIWFVRGFSLFIKFNESEVTEQFCVKFSASNHSLPTSNNFLSISFSHQLFESLAKKKKKLNEIIESVQKVWISNRMSNFTYLLILNFFANRSFSCASQYPVMPWPIEQRDMSKPMGQQTARRGLSFASNLTILPDEFMYKELYSNPSIVLHFMQRIQPFTNYLIELNKGLFDDKNKLFKSIQIEWEESSEKSKTNVEELIPEFFVLPEIFTNQNHVSLLKAAEETEMSTASLVTSSMNLDTQFDLPSGVPSCTALSHLLRVQLNQSQEVEKWIDLTFGAKSRGEKALESLNVFSPCTIGKVTTYVENETDLAYNMIENGVLPTQLFAAEHPAKGPAVRRGRQPSLVKSGARILSQELVLKAANASSIEKVDAIFFDEGKIELISIVQLFLDVLDRKVIFDDGLFRWLLPASDCNSLDASDSGANSRDANSNLHVMAIKLAFDKSMMAVVIEGGTLLVYRCLAGKNKKMVTSLDHLTSCFLPSEFLESFVGQPFNCCAISPHLNLAVEASGSTVFCFHLSSSKFIRTIEFDHNLQDVQISDCLQLIFAFGRSNIEAVTINGTKIASTEIEGEITAASIDVSETDDEVVAATGMQDGSIVLWSLDLSLGAFQMRARFEFDAERRRRIRLLKLVKNGAALFAVDAGGRSKAFVTADGVDGALLLSGAVMSCARCGRRESQYYECSMCKLFFCQNCAEVTDSVAVCKNCLEAVVKNSSIDTL